MGLHSLEVEFLTGEEGAGLGTRATASAFPKTLEKFYGINVHLLTALRGFPKLEGVTLRKLSWSDIYHFGVVYILEPLAFISGVERVEGWSHKMAVKRPMTAVGRTGGGEADGGKNTRAGVTVGN